MIEIKGKYNEAIVYVDELEASSVGIIQKLVDDPASEGSKIRIMPDVHAGKGCVIGTTMTLHDRVVPFTVGVDIGCAVHVVKLKERRIDLPKLDSVIRNNVPCGRGIRRKTHAFARSTRIRETVLPCGDYMYNQRSIGSIGGGNHFASIEQNEAGDLYLLIHTGSRNAGKQLAESYQKKAYDLLVKDNPDQVYELSYVEGEWFDNYLHDMEIMQEFADLNRRAIADVILDEMHLHAVDEFTTVHNYIDIENKILRKGSVSAQAGERLIVPLNMKDGSLICIGKGNPDWNYSSPHGAGRLYSRTDARNNISMTDFKESMKGIFSTSVNKGTLDEAPQAYKPAEFIENAIEPTATVVEHLKPIYNFKAS